MAILIMGGIVLMGIKKVEKAFPFPGISIHGVKALEKKSNSNIKKQYREFESCGLTKFKGFYNKQILKRIWSDKECRLNDFYNDPSNRHHLQPGNGLSANRIWIRDNWRQISIKVFGFCFWCSVVPVWLFHLEFLPFVQASLVRDQYPLQRDGKFPGNRGKFSIAPVPSQQLPHPSSLLVNLINIKERGISPL